MKRSLAPLVLALSLATWAAAKDNPDAIKVVKSTAQATDILCKRQQGIPASFGDLPGCVTLIKDKNGLTKWVSYSIYVKNDGTNVTDSKKWDKIVSSMPKMEKYARDNVAWDHINNEVSLQQSTHYPDRGTVNYVYEAMPKVAIIDRSFGLVADQKPHPKTPVVWTYVPKIDTSLPDYSSKWAKDARPFRILSGNYNKWFMELLGSLRVAGYSLLWVGGVGLIARLGYKRRRKKPAEDTKGVKPAEPPMTPREAMHKWVSLHFIPKSEAVNLKPDVIPELKLTWADVNEIFIIVGVDPTPQYANLSPKSKIYIELGKYIDSTKLLPEQLDRIGLVLSRQVTRAALFNEGVIEPTKPASTAANTEAPPVTTDTTAPTGTAEGGRVFGRTTSWKVVPIPMKKWERANAQPVSEDAVANGG
jgi:hypothetical protein